MGKTQLAKAYVQIVPSADGIKGSISSVLGNEASSAGNSAGGIAGSNLVSKIKGVIAAAGIGKALQSALEEGANLQQSIGGIETLFKDSADKVIENAKNAYKTAGMSANEYMETVTSFSASLLQGLGGDTETAANIADMALTDMSDNANKMGTSMELIQNAYQGFAKQNYTMLDNLKLGYGGTKTEMQRLLADAQELTGIEYSIDNLSDIYSAIHAIQNEMGITGTTAKEAASTFSGSMASMKAAFSNVLGSLTLGEDIGPSLRALSETVFTFVKDNLLPMVGNALSGLPELLSSVLGMAIRGLNLIAKNTDSLVQQGTALIGELVVGIVSAVPYLAESAFRVISSFGNAILDTDWTAVAKNLISTLRENMDLAAGEILGTDGNIVKSILDAITTNLPVILKGGVGIVAEIANGVLAGIPEALFAMGDLLDLLLNSIFEMAPSVLQSGFTLVSELVNGIASNLPAIGEATVSVVSKLLDTLVESLPDILRQGMDLIGELAAGFAGNYPAILSSVYSVIADLLAAIGKHLPTILQQGIAMVGELVAGLIKGIPKVVAAIPELIGRIVDEFAEHDWGKIGSDILSGIANGITNGVGAIVEAAKEAASSALQTAKKWLGIASPSKVMRDQVGKFVPLGVAEGIKRNLNPISKAMRDITKMTTGTTKNDLNVVARANTGMLDSKTQAKTVNMGGVSINVYAAEGQDPREIAEAVDEVLAERYERQREVYA